MKMKSLVFGLIATVALTVSCSNGQKIETWDPVLFEYVGAPFLTQPTKFIEFSGPFADGKNNDGIVFFFETENHDQSRKYVEKCIKGLVKYADNVYDLSEYYRSGGKLTYERLQKNIIDKDDVRISGSQWGGAYRCSVAYSKDGKYFKFTGGYQVYNNHKRATCTIGVVPLTF